MPPDDLHYRFYIADIPYEVVTGKFHPPVPSLVDFYNETGHSSMLVERPVRPSIFLLFRDLAVDRRLMSTCTSFFFCARRIGSDCGAPIICPSNDDLSRQLKQGARGIDSTIRRTRIDRADGPEISIKTTQFPAGTTKISRGKSFSNPRARQMRSFPSLRDCNA